MFFTNVFLWYVVRSYYDSLKMMKRLTEEVVVPIPCPAVSYHQNQNESPFDWLQFHSICFVGSVSLSQREHVHRRWWLQASVIGHVVWMPLLVLNCKCNNNMNWLNSQNVGGGGRATLLETNVIEEEKERKNKENVPFDLYLIYVEFPH